MKQNVGIADGVIRFLSAAVLAVLYFTDAVSGTTGTLLLATGGLLLLTSLLRYCPLYSLAGISSCHSQKEKT